MSNIGMMEGAFFVGRKEILDWINSTLELNLTRIEDTASGAAACQLLDIMYPNQVPVSKINWSAKQDFEFVANYKILQTCFTKLGIEKHVDVDRLISGKYMDNLEFMQWFKRFFEMAIPEKVTDYDCVAQRSKGKGGATYFANMRKGSAAPAAAASAASKPPSARPAVTRAVSTKPPKPAETPRSAVGQENSAPNLGRTASMRTEKPSTAPPVAVTKNPKNLSVAVEESAALPSSQETEDLRKQNEDLKADLDGIEKERDFYFDKLREIEVLLQDEEDKGQGTELTAAIFKILYATADGFETVSADEVGAADPAVGNDVADVPPVAVEETY